MTIPTCAIRRVVDLSESLSAHGQTAATS
jgi:hypothetical protein